MAGCSSCEVKFDGASAAYRRVLWTVIAISASMFVAEMASGIAGLDGAADHPSRVRSSAVADRADAAMPRPPSARDG